MASQANQIQKVKFLKITSEVASESSLGESDDDVSFSTNIEKQTDEINVSENKIWRELKQGESL